MCGTVGYIINARREEAYLIIEEQLILKFELDYSTIVTKKMILGC